MDSITTHSAVQTHKLIKSEGKEMSTLLGVFQHHRAWLVALAAATVMLFVGAAAVRAQTANPAAVNTGTTGNEFIFGVMDIYNYAGSAATIVAVFLTSDVATTVNVEYPLGTLVQSVALTPGQVTKVDIPYNAAHGWTRGQATANAVRLASTGGNDFAAYYLTTDGLTPNSADAAILVPTSSVGSEYLVINYNAWSPINPQSAFVVVATEDATTVTITPKAALAGGFSANTPTSVTLNRGQGFLGVAASGNQDLTGTLVTADKPVSLTNGSRCNQVPNNVGACDAFFEVAQPVSAWGTRYLVASSPLRPSGSIYRVLAATDGTIVRQDGTQIATLGRGEFKDIGPLPDNHVFECSAPCAVVQYITGGTSSPDGTAGDPSMSNLIPPDQFLNAYTFATAGPHFKQNWVQIFAKTSDVQANSVLLDGSPATGFSPIAGTEYSVATVAISDGTHTTSSPDGHGIQVIGYAFAISYQYSGGANVLDLLTSKRVTPVAGPGGALRPSSAQVVKDGKTFTFTVEAQPLHRVTNVTGCGGTLSSDGQTYTTAAITADCTVTATFQTVPVDFGDAPDSYGSTSAANGPYHVVDATNLRLGAAIDAEGDGLPGSPADGDDKDNTDDEDAVGTLPMLSTIATAYTIDNIAVTNNTGAPATLYGWVDFNGNGAFDAGERATAPVANGATSASLSWTGLSGLAAGQNYLRLRLADQSGLTALGPGGKGEVEDHPLDIVATGTIVIEKTVVAAGVGGSFAFTDTISAPNSFSLAGGNRKTFVNVLPGAYTVAELDPSGVAPGYALTGLRCDDGSSATPSTGDLATRTAAINLDPGETVTCTYTNSEDNFIIVEKVTEPAGGAGFGFVITDTVGAPTSFTLGHGQLFTDTVDATGVYTISETALPPGFDIKDVTCTGGGSAAINGVTVVLTFNSLGGEAAHCTFTNTQRGRIVLHKETLPDGDPQSFAYSANGPAGAASVPNLQDGGSHTIANAKPGAWTIAETIPGDWELSALTCTSLLRTSAYTPTLSSGALAVDLAPGDTMDCTFTNSKREHITIHKVVVPTPQSGGPSFPFDKPDTSLKHGESFTRDLAPGVSSTVVEDDPASLGYAVTGISCTDNQGGTSYDVFLAKREVVFTGAPGLVASCTFTNTLLGSIVIEKSTQPALSQYFAFSTTVPVRGFPDLSFSLKDGESQRMNNIVPGAYRVTEYWPGSDVSLSNITCDDGNSATPSVPIRDQRTATVNVDPGETVTCTFDNVQSDTVIIRKVTRPGGDTTTDFAFTSNLPGAGAFTLKSGGLITVTGVIPGQAYTVNEGDPAPGYDLVDVSCRDTSSGQTFQGDLTARNVTFTPQAGHVVDCTFTNQKRGAIVVKKLVQPPDANPVFNFVTSVGGGSAFDLSDGEQEQFQNVKPGQYTIQELASTDDIRLGSILCVDSGKGGKASVGSPGTRTATVNLDPGETVTCTFTNVENDAVIVQNLTLPGNDTTTGFAFSSDLPGAASFTLQSGELKVITGVVGSQSYTVTMADPTPAYDLVELVCFDTFSNVEFDGNLAARSVTFDAADGHLIYCAFLNVQRASVTIAKATTPASNDSFDFTLNGAGGPYTRSVAAGAPVVVANLEPGAYTLIEGAPTAKGYDLQGYACVDGQGAVTAGATVTSTLQLQPGENVTCTYTNVKRGEIRIRQTVDSGPTGPFEFRVSDGSTTEAITFTLSSGGEFVASGLVAGQAYNIGQLTPDGSAVIRVACTDSDPNGTPSEEVARAGGPGAVANLDPGETVTCTFTNSNLSERLYLPVIANRSGASSSFMPLVMR